MKPKKRLSRREREKQRQRDDMLDAAMELFSQRGYHNVSMNEIAEKAEFAVGTLYKFFKNKEDLYRSLMLQQVSRFHEVLASAMEEGGDEIARLRNYVRTKGLDFMAHATVVRLYHAEIRNIRYSLRAGLGSEIFKYLNDLRTKLAKLFESGIQRGLFKPTAEPYQLAVALDSICNGFLFLWLEDPENNAYPEDPDVILNILFKGMIAG